MAASDIAQNVLLGEIIELNRWTHSGVTFRKVQQLVDDELHVWTEEIEPEPASGIVKR
jgi:hypothetical protein